MARLIVSSGMLMARARSTARRRRKLPSWSAPPALAATLISRPIFVKLAPRLTSLTPFWRLICDHLECPDIGRSIAPETTAEPVRATLEPGFCRASRCVGGRSSETTRRAIMASPRPARRRLFVRRDLTPTRGSIEQMKTKRADLPHLRSGLPASHPGAGKTALAERLLFDAGAITRLGRVDDGTASLDYEPEEQKRKQSLTLAVASLGHAGTRIQLVDTPGY